MDGKRFDDISRLLGRSAGRRGVVKSALGVILGGGAVAAGLDEASATKPLRGRPYRSTCTANRQCRTPLICRREKSLPRLDRNRCGCPEGLVYCGGDCVELGTTDNCLACGDTCATNEVCCADGNGCTELGTLDDCADCGDACNPDTADICFDDDSDRFCACGENGEICDGENELCCDGTCVDSHSDIDNCGSCGNVCAVACYGGECHGEVDGRVALLDADGNGYTPCEVLSGRAATVSCTTNADCGGFTPECMGPNNRCVCAVESTYVDSNPANNDIHEYNSTCRVVTLQDSAGGCFDGIFCNSFAWRTGPGIDCYLSPQGETMLACYNDADYSYDMSDPGCTSTADCQTWCNDVESFGCICAAHEYFSEDLEFDHVADYTSYGNFCIRKTLKAFTMQDALDGACGGW